MAAAVTQRIALGLEYDGTGFSGWQTQKDGPTIQGCVQDALSTVADHHVQVTCAGRTDSGVHATHQVVHFDTSADRRERGWVLGTNTQLPPAVRIHWARVTDTDFHARFEALARSYRYVIVNRETGPALNHRRVWCVHQELDAEKMQTAAEQLIGEHDFSSFRAAECQSNSPYRNVYRFEVHRSGDFVFVDIEANAFLHRMVRNIVGALVHVGNGTASPGWVDELLEAKDRRAGAVTAPSQGLYLVDVRYPDRYDLPRGKPPSLF